MSETIVRGELRCFACSRYLGDFQSRTDESGISEVDLLQPEFGELAQHAVREERGLRCSRCGGRVMMETMERLAA